jgi:hypothetical protein
MVVEVVMRTALLLLLLQAGSSLSSCLQGEICLPQTGLKGPSRWVIAAGTGWQYACLTVAVVVFLLACIRSLHGGDTPMFTDFNTD